MQKKILKNKIIYLISAIFLVIAGLLIRGCYLNNTGNKIALFCLDGATWTLMQPLLDKGELPNFAWLVNNGVHGELFSKDAFSPPCWTTIATGKVKEKHGVNNFSQGRNKKVRYLWNILSDYNIKVGVFDWLLNSCEKVNGAAYSSNYHKKIVCSYPPSVEKEVARNFTMYPFADWHSEEVYKLMAISDANIHILNTFLINKFNPDFLAMGFYGTDVYQHRYWSALEPEYFDIDREEVEEKGKLITGYYKKIDKLLEEFIEGGYTIIFVSDHGACRNDLRSGPRIIKYYQVCSDKQHVNFLMNILLEKLNFLVFIPKPEGGATVDFMQSKAYYYNSLESGEKGIKINRQVVPEKEIPGIQDKIYLLLKNARFETGEKVFSEVSKNPVGRPGGLPDITFELSLVFQRENLSLEEIGSDHQHISARVFGRGRKELKNIIIEGRKYQLSDFIDYSRDGVHEHEGVLIMAGKNINEGKFIQGARLEDITPTILYLSGLPAAQDMDGTILLQAIDADFLRKHPPKFINTYESKSGKDKITDDSAIDITIDKETLRSLGYAQ